LVQSIDFEMDGAFVDREVIDFEMDGAFVDREVLDSI